MEKAKAYMIAKYSKDDPGLLDGIDDGDLLIAMKPSRENIILAKSLYEDGFN